MTISYYTALFLAFTSNALLAAIGDIPAGWQQVGIGVVALFILYRMNERQAKAREKTDERQAEASERVAASMEEVVRANTTATEVLRGLLTRAEDAARRDEALVLALNALACAREARHGNHPATLSPALALSPSVAAEGPTSL